MNEEDPFSVENLADFFRYGVENYNSLGAVAFPDLAHRLMAPCSSVHSVIHGWAESFKTSRDPDDSRKYQNIQSAAEAILREKADAMRAFAKTGASSDAEQSALFDSFFCAMQIADALGLEAAPKILDGIIVSGFLHQWKPGENFSTLLTATIFPQGNAPVSGNIPSPSSPQ